MRRAPCEHEKKRNQYGTLTRYRVKYDCGPESGWPGSSYLIWAYDLEHAHERFHESNVEEGFDLVSIQPHKCRTC